MNTRNLFDIIIEKVTLKFPEGRPSIIADVAVNKEEIRDAAGTHWIGRVVDIGDMSVFSSHEKWNGEGKSIDGTSVEINDIVDLQELLKKIK